MDEMRALFVSRLATVDKRHAEAPPKERERIKGEIGRMIGADMHGLIGERSPQLPFGEEPYHGEF
jgi:hypothetical protein